MDHQLGLAAPPKERQGHTRRHELGHPNAAPHHLWRVHRCHPQHPDAQPNNNNHLRPRPHLLRLCHHQEGAGSL